MKYLFLLLLLAVTSAHAQTALQFDKRFVESEDKWVAFPMDQDGNYSFGFIYIDAQAGLTLNHEGYFKINTAGNYIPEKLDSVSLKVRLQNNDVKVAFIPDSKLKELQVPLIPDWLHFYKNDTNSVERLYHWGFMYNGWELCAKALTYLERAERVDPEYEGLAVELAFSYNCLARYDKAISVLDAAIATNPTDAYTNKELIFALIKSGQLNRAVESCKRALEICKETSFHGEMCYNILYEYYKKKDKENFNVWVKLTKKWAKENENILYYVGLIEKEMEK